MRLGEAVELVLEVFSILDVPFEAEDCPLVETDWLLDDRLENSLVVKGFGFSNNSVSLLSIKENAGLLEYLSFNVIWFQADLKVPLFDLFGLSNHLVHLLNACDSISRSLEKTLLDICHLFLVFSDYCRNTDQDTQLRRQKDALPFLLDLK